LFFFFFFANFTFYTEYNILQKNFMIFFDEKREPIQEEDLSLGDFSF